jgi:hypothetical protein
MKTIFRKEYVTKQQNETLPLLTQQQINVNNVNLHFALVGKLQ